MMYPKNKRFIGEFAARTKENYSRVEYGPYEVTQLINSMVGLFIFLE